MLATMKAWITAGEARLSHAGDTEEDPISPAVAEDFRTGLRSWRPYLRRAGSKADGYTAELIGETYFLLLEIGSRDLGKIESNAAEAARALEIAGRHRRTLFTLSNVAVYDYFNGEFARGERAARGAAADSGPNLSRRAVLQQLHEYRERAEYFRGQLRRAAEELEETGERELSEPLKAFASSLNLNDEEPAGFRESR